MDAQESCGIGMMPDRPKLDRFARVPEQEGGAPDDELADPPFAESAADEDALCVAPRREFQETLDYLAKRMRKVLDGADQRSGREPAALSVL
jgi:hypothetical protein